MGTLSIILDDDFLKMTIVDYKVSTDSRICLDNLYIILTVLVSHVLHFFLNDHKLTNDHILEHF